MAAHIISASWHDTSASTAWGTSLEYVCQSFRGSGDVVPVRILFRTALLAALIEFAFFLMIPFTMVAYSQRFGFPKVGVAAALMIFCSPVFSISGSSAYNDAATVLILFCLFYSLQIWDRTRQPTVLVIAGLLAGFSYGIKYSAFVATPYCIGYVVWKLYRAKQPIVRPLLLVGGCALLLIAPWWIKNLATVGNPLAPFGNKVFSITTSRRDLRRNT